jgi:hypothetical protein
VSAQSPPCMLHPPRCLLSSPQCTTWCLVSGLMSLPLTPYPVRK